MTSENETDLESKRQRAEALLPELCLRVGADPGDPELRFAFGECLLEAGRIDEAINELQRAQQGPTVRWRAMMLLARCFLQKGMLDAEGEEKFRELTLVFERAGARGNF